MVSGLHLFTIFHLNIAYSSIETEARSEVVERCYWPLLRLARELDLPFGIEASAYTLEVLAEIAPECLRELRRLTTDGPCEFIGSGYAQIIGPLVPAQVNAANLRLGLKVYEQLLGKRPRLALVNEQAYSAGMVGHYLDAGYTAIVMDWNNPAGHHPEWNPEWRYHPQYACSGDGRKIPLLWNNSIFFQKFQRYVHGESELEEYLDFIHHHVTDSGRFIALYGNDVEIFDFRPGRYATEPDLHGDRGGEWKRISDLFRVLKGDNRLRLISPCEMLDRITENDAGNLLRLESTQEPIPVKKQAKYNVSRWAISGRDDLGINTACWRIFRALQSDPDAKDEKWKELCYVWSSDFRTHITERRWTGYNERLMAFEKQLGIDKLEEGRRLPLGSQAGGGSLPLHTMINEVGGYLTVEVGRVKIRLNCRRGLAIDALWFKDVSSEPLCGTLPHGYFDDISLGADFYTGHLVLEAPGRPRLTDLSPVIPQIHQGEDGEVTVSVSIATPLGMIEKIIVVGDNAVKLTSRLNWQELPLGSLRVAAITLNPLAFDRQSLMYRTHNGGFQTETFVLTDQPVNHGESASFLVSAKQVLGITEGIVELGDGAKVLRVSVDKQSTALVGLVTFRPAGASYFARCSFSANEMDETSRAKHLSAPLVFSITLTAA